MLMQITERHSANLGDLATALAKAQAEIKTASKNSNNPHYGSTYANLASVWDACREPLTKNGLSVVQQPVGDGDKIGVTTILLHSSGQYMQSTVTTTPDRKGPQAAGSCISYLRRYSLAAIVSVCPDDDDDAEAATDHRTPPQSARATLARPANDNGSARRAGPPPAPDGKTPPSSSGKSVLSQWRAFSALREKMGVTEDEARARVSNLVGRKIVEVAELSYGELERVIAKMTEAASGNV